LTKIEMVDNEAPTIISDAMGNMISINKAALMTYRLRGVPEDEREAEAKAFMAAQHTVKMDKIDRDYSIMRKFHDMTTICLKYYTWITEECADVYVRDNVEKVESILENIDDEIDWLNKLRKLIVDAGIKYKDAQQWKI